MVLNTLRRRSASRVRLAVSGLELVGLVSSLLIRRRTDLVLKYLDLFMNCDSGDRKLREMTCEKF